MKIDIALFEPDIPQNTGTILRMADCFGLTVHIIEPCGFIFGGSHMKRAGMDYLNTVNYKLHPDYSSFVQYINDNNKRIVLSTTKTTLSYTDFKFQNNDVILFGKESKGVTDYIQNTVSNKITIKMQEGKRSLNLAMSCAMITAEAIRQLS